MKVSTALLWPYYRLRQPWKDNIKQFDYLDWETQRKLALRQIDKGGYGYWTVFVAGAGFLTDAYDIFAVNTVLPMINVVYWGGRMPPHTELAINLAVLVGTLLSQVMVGLLADRYGRKRMYGYELIILMLATIFVAITSEGLLRSTNKLGWLVAWRFMMGIGIGGDYPLSSVITSEFAPRRHRARMLATLFFMQPVGALIANVVAVTVILALRRHIPLDVLSTSCHDSCALAVDRMWRWIVGIGAIPPAFAILLRWWIPESPRYTLEVEMDPDRATRDVNDYYQMPSSSRADERASEQVNLTPTSNFSPRTINTEATLTFGEPAMVMKDLSLAEPALSLRATNEVRMVRKETWAEFWAGFRKYFIDEGNWTDLAGTAIAWLVLDFAFYLLGVNSPKILGKLWSVSDYALVPLHEKLLENAYRPLIAQSTGAVLGGALFIALASWRWHLQFYGFIVLGVLFVIVGVCFVTLINTQYAAAVIVLYACCSLFFNFGPNTSTFILAAEVFPAKYRCTAHGFSAAAGKLGSILAQIFLTYARFNGVGATDLSAAPAAHTGTTSTWLGWVLLIFSGWMVVGAVVTKIWVPNPSNLWGKSRTLEDLARGKAARRRFQRQEREAWDLFVPGSPGPSPSVPAPCPSRVSARR